MAVLVKVPASIYFGYRVYSTGDAASPAQAGLAVEEADSV
jgi:hypothetical protein